MLHKYFVLPVCLFVILSLSKTNVMAAKKQDWKDVTTVAETVSAYPQKMKQLMHALDLGRPDLQHVREAWENDDLEGACRALLEHYRTGNTAEWLRPSEDESPPEPRPRIIQIANNIVERDVYRGFGEKGKVPRGDGGHLVWTHTGPKGDLQFRARLNRHPQLNRLLHAYKSTGKEKYLNRLDMDLRDWLIASEGHPSKEGWGSHLEPANRLPTWARVFYALQNDDGFHPSTRLLLLATIPRHARYLLKNPGGGNWVTMTQLGALTCGACWPEFKQAEHWRKKAFAKLQENAHESVYPDGAQKELTAAYHMVSLTRYSRCVQLMRNADLEVPEEFIKTVRNMWNYIAYVVRPDGTRPMNNDSGLRSQRDGIIRAAEQYDRPDWLYIATNGREGQKPDDPPSRFFPYAGQLISRSGWGEDAQWSFFDIGPWGLGHQHNDHGHLSIMASGRHLLVDGGRFAYQGKIAEKYRDPYAHHTRGHNTILVDGHGQSSYQRTTDQPHPFRSINDAFDFAVGTFDAGYKSVEEPAQHTRATLYLRGLGWIVTDYLKIAGQHEVRPLWHFHPNCTVKADAGAVFSSDADKGNLRITPTRPDRWKVELARGQNEPTLQGWYSRSYGEVEPATCAVYRDRITDAATFGWVMNTARGVPGKPAINWLEAPEGVARMNVTLPEGPTYTVTTVLDDAILPLDLPDGRTLTARLLLERKGHQPRVACGWLLDADGTTLAADPLPVEAALADLAGNVELQSDGAQKAATITLPLRNVRFADPLKVEAKLAGDIGSGWQLSGLPAEKELRLGETDQLSMEATAPPDRPRYPLPQLEMTLELPQKKTQDQPIRQQISRVLPVTGRQPSLKVRKIRGEPSIDGSLDEELWRVDPDVPVLGSIKTGRSVEPVTRAWTACDSQALYIAFRCSEPEIGKLKSRAKKRDERLYLDDSVEIMLDPAGDGQTYYQIVVNTDEVIFDGRKFDTSTDLEGLRVGTSVEGDHWTAEIAIPWKDVGLDGPPEDAGILFCRNRHVTGEHQVFQFPVSPSGNHQPNYFAQIFVMGEKTE